MANTRKDGKRSAPRVILQEGENSIERASVLDLDGGPGRIMTWRILLPGTAKSIKHTTQSTRRVTDGALRRKAKATAAELMQTHGTIGAWTQQSAVADYIEAIVLPEINDSDLADLTKVAYRRAIRRLLGDCPGMDCDHVHSLKRLNIATASRYRPASDCVKEIGKFHGAGTAKLALTVYQGHILQRLLHEEVIEHNVLNNAKIDFKSKAKKPARPPKTSVAAIDEVGYHQAVTWLLDLDPSDGVGRPKEGRWTFEDRLRKPTLAINLTLLQAGSGLRLSEALKIRRELFDDSEAFLRINVTKDVAKRKIPRTAYVLEPRIADRIRELLAQPGEPKDPLLGQPRDPRKLWDRNNASEAVREYYKTMHRDLNIEELEYERTHIWRATLNTIFSGRIPPKMLSAQFGHSTGVNLKSYTKDALTPAMVAYAIETLTPQ